jgi:hypothetical protein
MEFTVVAERCGYAITSHDFDGSEIFLDEGLNWVRSHDEVIIVDEGARVPFDNLCNTT